MNTTIGSWLTKVVAIALIGCMLLPSAGANFVHASALPPPAAAEPAGEAPPPTAEAALAAAEQADPSAEAVQRSGNELPLVFGNLVFRGNAASHDAFIEIGKGQRAGQGSYLVLDFAHSELLLPELSSFSVRVDDLPVAAFTLDRSNTNAKQVKIDISHLQLGPGYHKISLAAQMKMTPNACENPSHEGLWMVIYQSSAAVLQLEPIYDKADLSWYPSPFLERGGTAPLQTLLVVPDGVNESEFQAAALLSQFFASQSPNGKLPIPIYTESDVTEAMLQARHTIWIGQRDRWQGVGQQVAAAEGSQLPESGAIQLVESPWNAAKSALLLTGNDAQLYNAAAILSTELLYGQLQGSLIRVPESMDGAEAERNAALPDDPAAGQPYFVSFGELGYNNLRVENVLQGSTSISYSLPPQLNIAENTKLQLKYAHSKAIVYGKSVMTVRLNGTPVESVGLVERTSEGGVLEVRLDPAVVGPARTLSIEIVFQFANPAADEEVDREFNCTDSLLGDWATIDSQSGIVVVPAVRSTEALQSLPFPFITDRQWEPTVFLMPRMDSRSLQLAMTFIGSMGAGSRPGVSRILPAAAAGADLADRIRNCHVVYAGTAADLPADLNGYPESYVRFIDGQIQSMSPEVPLLESLRQNFAVIQLTKSPLNNDRSLLTFAVAAPERMDDLRHTLTDPEQSGALTGRFIAVNGAGTVFNFPGTQPAAPPPALSLNTGSSRWQDFAIGGIWFAVIFLFILFAAIFAAVRLYRKQKK